MKPRYNHAPVTEEAKAAAHAFYKASMTPKAQAAMTAEAEMMRMDVAADRAGTAREEEAKAAWKAAVEWAPRPDQRPIAAAALLAFVRAGNAAFTVVSKATGTRFTYRVRQTAEDKPWFVGVLTGPDNTASYTFLGTIFADGTYRHGKRSSIGEDAPSAKAAKWFFGNLASGQQMSKCAVYHEGRCCRCGRKLTVPSSVESGIGPECAKGK